MIKRIVVPIDGSDHSKKALDFACDLASKYDSDLYLIHVVQSVPEERTMVLGSSSVSLKTTHEELKIAGKGVIDAAKDIADNHNCHVADTKIAAGSPSKQILKYAEWYNPNMIIMGSRGLSDIEGLLLGSVSHKIGHLAQCTCITVR